MKAILYLVGCIFIVVTTVDILHFIDSLPYNFYINSLGVALFFLAIIGFGVCVFKFFEAID